MNAEERDAALTVAEHADSTDDARLMLQMLGLVPSPVPRKNRVVCPGGCQHGADVGHCFYELPQAPSRPRATPPQTSAAGGLQTGYAVLHWMLANGYAQTVKP